MIRPTMAVEAVGATHAERVVFARDARLARCAALVLDSIVFAFISFVVNSVYGITHLETFPTVILVGGPYVTSVGWPVTMGLLILYFAIPEALFGATPGKHWMRLKVVRIDGRPLDVPAVIVRNLLRPIDGLPIGYLLGGALVLLGGGSQRVGDLAGGTTVVHRHHATERGATRSSGPGARRLLVGLIAGALAFTAAFDYFGRPPLVIQGDFNERLSFGPDVAAYSLGSPVWGFGEVTYPITLSTATAADCRGTITLRWEFLGWTESRSGYACFS